MLKSADVILAEDTRHSGKLLQYYGIKTPLVSTLMALLTTYHVVMVLKELLFGSLFSLSDHCLFFMFQMSYHKFNESQRERPVLKRLQQGEIVALITDAGMPGISDPGTELVS